MYQDKQENSRVIHTVLGPISPNDLGSTLVHEHILVDFVGARRISRERYDAKIVLETMLPFLNQRFESISFLIISLA